MTLRTLHVTNAWHATSGGIATFYRALLQTAGNLPWQMRLVVPSPESRYEQVGAGGGIYHVRAPRAPFSPEYRVLYPHSYLLPRSPLREILRREQPHLVEVNDKYTLIYLAGLLRIRAIGQVADRPSLVGLSCERLDETMSAYLQPGPLSRFFARRYMRHVYFPQVDHHITVSDHTAAELQLASHGHRIPRSISIRGMGVDTDLFSPTRRSRKFRNALCARAGAAESVQLLLYAGRLAPEKNLKLLLDTMEQLPHNGFRLLIAGDGPARGDFLSQAAARFPAQVAYLGHERDRDRLADLFANVDAFLHPNPREPFGIAPLEAMAAGAPLVAPNSGGVTAYANSSNAWLVEPRGEAFATAVRQIASDPAGRGSRVAAARATALRFSWPAICAGYYALYRDLWATMARREPERVLASAS